MEYLWAYFSGISPSWQICSRSADGENRSNCQLTGVPARSDWHNITAFSPSETVTDLGISMKSPKTSAKHRN